MLYSLSAGKLFVIRLKINLQSEYIRESVQATIALIGATCLCIFGRHISLGDTALYIFKCLPMSLEKPLFVVDFLINLLVAVCTFMV